MDFGLAVGILILSGVGAAIGSFVRSYMSEKGKQVATHQDIENVLDQVKRVTLEQETIKAEISGGLWSRQTLWNQKREVYARLLRVTGDLLLTVAHVDAAGTSKSPAVLAERESAVRRYAECISELRAVAAEAKIFANSEAQEAYQKLTGLDFWKTLPEKESNEVMCKALYDFRARVVLAAKRDLFR